MGLSFFAGWRGLGRFWLLTAGLLAAGAAVLQILGPPPAPPRPAPSPKVAPEPAEHRPAAVADKLRVLTPPPAQPALARPGRDTPGPIADPDPALTEPDPAEPGHILPRIAPDGRMPMQVYAAGFDGSSRRAKVGLLIAGIGLSDADSMAAIRDLPGGVTLAVSPYTLDPRKLLGAARAGQHEYLVAIPMEPREFPLNDPGPRTLMTTMPPAQNMERLRWVLSRIDGYVGATGIWGALRGERFAAMTDQMDAVAGELGRRGLLYVDGRIGQAATPHAWSRSIDLVIDEPADQAGIDSRLEALMKLALDRGAALGVATVPRPLTVARIAAWANGLAGRGVALAPVSALAVPPPGKPSAP